MNGNRMIIALMLGMLSLGTAGLHAQGPACVNYQGRIVRSGTNFDGVALFKFKLLDPSGTTAFWSNDGTGGGGAEPALAVPIPVSRGLFTARLGDTNLSNMATLPIAVFTNADLRLRLWIDSGSGSEQITPDQPLGSVAYAMISASVMDGAVTPAKLAPESRALFNPVTGLVGGECDTNRLDILCATNYTITGVKVLQTAGVPQLIRVYTNGVSVDAFALTTDRVERALSLTVGPFDRLGIACTNLGGTVLFSFEGHR